MNFRQFTFCTLFSAIVVLAGCTGPQGDTVTADDSGKQMEGPSQAPPAGPSGAATDTGVPATETSVPDTAPASAPVDSAPASPDTSADTVTATSAPDSGSLIADTGTFVDSSTDTAKADTFVADTFVPDTFVADTAAADTAVASPETGTPTTVGELVLHVRLPRWGTSHTTVLKGYEYPPRDGGATWGSALGASTGKGVDLTLTIAKGSTFVFTGFYDGDPSKAEDWTNSFVDYATGTIKVAIWGSFNGVPIARPIVKKNDSGDGYNITVIAAPSPLISATDEDGDGFSKSVDCNDSPAGGQAFHPYQVEAPEDSLDFNCDGKIDPPRYIIRLSSVALGYAPVVKDVVNWGRTYTLTWNSSIGAYESAPLEMEMLPREFFIEWGSGQYDSSYEGGSCNAKATVQIRRDLDGTLVPVTLKIAASGGTCHRFADL